MALRPDYGVSIKEAVHTAEQISICDALEKALDASIMKRPIGELWANAYLDLGRSQKADMDFITNEMVRRYGWEEDGTTVIWKTVKIEMLDGNRLHAHVDVT